MKTVSGKGLRVRWPRPVTSEGVTHIAGFEFYIPAGMGLLENHVQYYCAAYPSNYFFWVDPSFDGLLIHVRIGDVNYLLGHVECNAGGTAKLTRYLRPLWAKQFFMRLEKHLLRIGYKAVVSKRDNSGHFRYNSAQRREIVEAYRYYRNRGEITNKDAWAQANYTITEKTLRSYEREFPEPEE